MRVAIETIAVHSASRSVFPILASSFPQGSFHIRELVRRHGSRHALPDVFHDRIVCEVFRTPICESEHLIDVLLRGEVEFHRIVAEREIESGGDDRVRDRKGSCVWGRCRGRKGSLSLGEIFFTAMSPQYRPPL